MELSFDTLRAFVRKNLPSSFASSVGKKEAMNPLRDWKLLLIVAGILFAAVVSFNGYLFLSLSGSESITAGDDAPAAPEVIQKRQFTEAVDILTQRDVLYQELQRGTKRFADPSR